VRLMLRLTGIAALVLLLWNPPVTRRVTSGEAPTVLLDASLSMDVGAGEWRAALDTARALARGGVIWRFGTGVAGFDTTAPGDGASRLAPALIAAAARGGPIAVVTDGAVDDLDQVPADLLARARIVLLGTPPGPDAFVAAVEGPHQVAVGDTVTLRVTYGTSGTRAAETGKRRATLSLVIAGRTAVAKAVTLPDSGTVTTELTFPASRVPTAGWTALAARISWPGDPERRDDARLFPILVTPDPPAVILAAPPDWDATFLARTLGDVSRLPVRSFTEIAAGRWNDGTTLAPVSAAEVRKAAAGARLVVEVGDPAQWLVSRAPALLTWVTGTGTAGDWYVTPAAGAPVTGALGTVPWDSLAPGLAALPVSLDSGAVPVLEAQLARRGATRPVAALRETAAGRRVTLGVAGLYRWDFRGGASRQAYRTVVAALVDWLLAGGAGATDWARPDSLDVAAGLPVPWRWTGPGAPRDLPVTLAAPGASLVDTLRFGGDGRAALLLPPATYRYALGGGHGRGMVVVDSNSAEWRGTPVLSAQAGRVTPDRVPFDWRERWWVFALALAAFAAEWAWRRRLGLP